MVSAGDQAIGLAALYAVVELVKFMMKHRNQNIECILSGKNQAMLESMHKAITKEDEEGRHLIYMPKNFHSENERMMELMESISRNQKQTAVILEQLINRKGGVT